MLCLTHMPEFRSEQGGFVLSPLSLSSTASTLTSLSMDSSVGGVVGDEMVKQTPCRLCSYHIPPVCIRK